MSKSSNTDLNRELAAFMVSTSGPLKATALLRLMTGEGVYHLTHFDWLHVALTSWPGQVLFGGAHFLARNRRHAVKTAHGGFELLVLLQRAAAVTC